MSGMQRGVGGTALGLHLLFQPKNCRLSPMLADHIIRSTADPVSSAVFPITKTENFMTQIVSKFLTVLPVKPQQIKGIYISFNRKY